MLDRQRRACHRILEAHSSKRKIPEEEIQQLEGLSNALDTWYDSIYPVGTSEHDVPYPRLVLRRQEEHGKVWWAADLQLDQSDVEQGDIECNTDDAGLDYAKRSCVEMWEELILALGAEPAYSAPGLFIFSVELQPDVTI